MGVPVRFAAPDPQRQGRCRVSFGFAGADHSTAGAASKMRLQGVLVAEGGAP